MRPLWICAAAGVAGMVALSIWFAQQWAGTPWKILPKEQVAASARELSQRLGYAGIKEDPVWTASVSKPLASYRIQHPEDREAQSISPLSVRLKNSAAEVGVDSSGLPMYWKVSDESPASAKTGAEKDLAQQSFLAFARGDAAAYGEPAKSMGDDPQQEDYVWKHAAAPNSGLREQISVSMKNGHTEKVERKLSFASGGDEDDDSDDDHGYWIVFSVAFWVLCTVSSIAAIAIFILWFVRKTVRLRFPLIVAGAAFFIMLAVNILRGTGGDSHITAVFAAVLIGCFAGVGRSISEAARPKWMSLEQLCFLAPIAQKTGESLLAGVFVSPLLVAIPFAIAGCGLFPHSFATLENIGSIYGRVPLFESVDVRDLAYTMGFFGFGVPAVRRLIGVRWLRWALVLTLGILFFSDLKRVVSGPLLAPVTAGLVTVSVLGFLYRTFDLLAVLVAQAAAGLVLSVLEFATKGGAWGPFGLALAVLVGVGLWYVKNGAIKPVGDPAGSVPEVRWFRAEREKLQAEFSVAKRAQEGMLPQTAPKRAGYSIAASCTPSLDVGGDLYDFLELPDGRLGIAVADVSGKGVPAALYMTLTKGLLGSVSRDSSDLGVVMEEVNRHLHSVTRKKVFVTMALGVLDCERRTLECVRAGHNPVVWRQAAANVTKLVSPPGLGLGITAGRIFRNQLRVEELALSEGDAVVFYSDGITEAMNSGLEQFGEERLMKAVEAADHLDAAGAHDAILAAVRGFLGGVHPQDDMTLVVLRVG